LPADFLSRTIAKATFHLGRKAGSGITTEVLSLTVLGSGSGGNCSLVTTGECRILIDCGFSARQVTQRLQRVGIDPASLDAVFITHEHGDHVAGLEVFSRRHKVPIYCNRLTADALYQGEWARQATWRIFETGSPMRICDLEISSFYVPHDAVDPVAFVLCHPAGSIGFLTDLGYAPKLALERLRKVDLLVIETNHDEQMLQADAKRPWSVKQRILSRHGHLSNVAAAKVVASLAGDRLQRVILGHLSRDCNRPELALEAMHAAGLDRLNLYCASQEQVSPTFEVRAVASAPALSEEVRPVYHHQEQSGEQQDFFTLLVESVQSQPPATGGQDHRDVKVIEPDGSVGE
jgi:phosphoribosyl 1,2-cyclic phosphodiesterase